MKFIDDKHEKFFYEKIKLLPERARTDIYYTSLIYTLGMCETTRRNFDKIFSIENGEINIDSIHKEWQTGTSQKVTRMAFSLWNGCMYDSDEEFENKQNSSGYNVDEIFSCSYAPYFYEGVRIRYPEYTREKEKENKLQSNDMER